MMSLRLILKDSILHVQSGSKFIDIMKAMGLPLIQFVNISKEGDHSSSICQSLKGYL